MRIDQYISQKYNLSRTKAQQLIQESLVKFNKTICNKVSTTVSENDIVELVGAFQFASLGGDKLYKAFLDFDFYPKDLICVDIGASNGGFTDCMLQFGAKKVYAIDVGECALGDNLKNNPKVVVVDKFNARELSKDTLGEMCDFVSIDVSFISLKYVLPNALNVLKKNGKIIALIKPQFEVGKQYLTKKGIVNSESQVQKIIKDIQDFSQSIGFIVLNITNAPIKINKNKEFLIFMQKVIE